MTSWLTRGLSWIAALFGAAIFVQVRSEFTMPLLPAKIIAIALSPLFLVMGLLGALLAAFRKDRISAILGLAGAAGSAWYIRSVTKPHGGFERAFGLDWRSRIPPERWNRMLQHRYMPWQMKFAPVQFQADVKIAMHLETGDPIVADLWQPADPSLRNGMGIIYLHGSGWHYLKKDFFTRPFFRQLAGEGYVVADVDYTMAPKADLRGMLADVYRAIAWMKANADSLGIQPDRIVLIGGSAGAHLAMLAAYAPDHPELKPPDVQMDTSVKAVVSYYGPGDLRLAHTHLYSRYGRVGHHRSRTDRVLMWTGGLVGRRIKFMPPASTLSGPGYLIPAVFGGLPEAVPLLYNIGSPITHIGPASPPTLLFHGAHDFAIDAEQSRGLYIALRRAGVPAVYVEFPYTEHVFDLFFSPWAPAFQAALYDTERFLALMNAK